MRFIATLIAVFIAVSKGLSALAVVLWAVGTFIAVNIILNVVHFFLREAQVKQMRRTRDAHVTAARKYPDPYNPATAGKSWDELLAPVYKTMED
jgi:hypothetical protein